ncbi:MAG: NAD(P)(+) transhydrogenase (Re/Si-specific) subunit beta, partial [Planctomycetota bacterium]|nr:NAD(P)(+) transhydrogenase (Re/Si-specific) subunit beta [Planctomycetota bacterium]
HPRTAVRGNLLGALAMLIAVVVTLVDQKLMAFPGGYVLIGIGLIIGAVIGVFLAIKIEMTAMPQLVALFNGLGGAASVLVAGAELFGRETTDMGIETSIVAAMLAGLIGAVTFWGSLVAFAKLQEIKAFKKPYDYPFQKPANAILAGLVLLLAIIGIWTGHPAAYILLVLVASVLGVTLVNPIGGADMPVVIALLNSYSGLAATATGFVLNNSVLIVAGSLVGASGLILTSIMCKAMNRSLTNVLFGVMGEGGEVASADDVYGGKVKSTSADEVAMLFETARRAVIVPGYGMAVAQAQHAVRDLMSILEDRGIEVEFAVHPVAGRMPGHMNVLLAEAEIPYEQLKELDEVNPAMSQTDVVLVIGANDVVNPEAHNPNSAIAGMPIIDCDKARTCIVIKRSLSPGFAGIPNPLFALENTLMYFGDGKKAILDLVAALKE